MKLPAFRPLALPDAPIIACVDCEKGRVDCGECMGTGTLQGHLYREFRCDMCNGNGTRWCVTCDGTACFPDPAAYVECPRCNEFIDADTLRCLNDECSYTFEAAA